MASTMFEKQEKNPLIWEPLMTEDVSTLKRLVKVNKELSKYSAVLTKDRDSVKTYFRALQKIAIMQKEKDRYETRKKSSKKCWKKIMSG